MNKIQNTDERWRGRAILQADLGAAQIRLSMPLTSDPEAGDTELREFYHLSGLIHASAGSAIPYEDFSAMLNVLYPSGYKYGINAAELRSAIGSAKIEPGTAVAAIHYPRGIFSFIPPGSGEWQRQTFLTAASARDVAAESALLGGTDSHRLFHDLLQKDAAMEQVVRNRVNIVIRPPDRMTEVRDVPPSLQSLREVLGGNPTIASLIGTTGACLYRAQNAHPDDPHSTLVVAARGQQPGTLRSLTRQELEDATSLLDSIPTLDSHRHDVAMAI